MGVIKLDHVGIIVRDLEAAGEFFAHVGLEREGGGRIEGPWVDAVVGLQDVRQEVLMMRTPDGRGRIELIRVDSPQDSAPPEAAPSNRLGIRNVAFEVEDVRATVSNLAEQGYGLVGEVAEYEAIYRLCYVRGPEGIIVMLAQTLGGGTGA